ncbi:hypothetical protein EYF80_030451 [Liparis tanakae]|uniref:Uncharacterized protein n=1 Tax=Liparis tanakae TaxID=230148 RepID=A0A4Z2H0J0_9TELE|nr:hypothetical protein EYF80_030451 [Liparis tanakae]
MAKQPALKQEKSRQRVDINPKAPFKATVHQITMKDSVGVISSLETALQHRATGKERRVRLQLRLYWFLQPQAKWWVQGRQLIKMSDKCRSSNLTS